MAEGPRSFAVLLSQLEDGQLHEELSVVVNEMQKELHEYSQRNHKNADGEIKLSIKFFHEPNGVVSVKASIDTKMPKTARHKSVF